MVIVHLSANLRRIISPEKNETLYQLFKRFCQEFSYREEEYEFQSYPEDNRVPLDININANRVKEVSLVQKRVSRINSDESCYTIIRDTSPVIIENRKKNAASFPVVNPPNERPTSEQITDNIKQKKQPKRNAPKAPVINDKITDDKNESKIPDFDIPPPPEFMPHEEPVDKEPYYKSVQCDTKESGTDQSRETSRSDSVTEASEPYLPPLEMCHHSDNVNESDKEDSNNNDYNENSDVNINFQPIDDHIESGSESSVEDVYEDESLLGNPKCVESKVEVKSSPSFEDKDEGDKCDELQSNDEDNLNINLNEQITESIDSLTNEEWKHPDHVSLTESIQLLNCPIAEMEETDIKSSNEYLSDSVDLIDYNVKICESQADNEEEIEINSTLTDQVDNQLNYEDPSFLCENDNTDSNNDEAPKPKTRAKHLDKSKAVSLDSGEILELPRSHSEISTETADKSACENEDILMEDGHPTDLPITIISEPSNPKFYWELPKQSKTIQIMSRAYNTIDIPEPKVVQKIEQSKAPSTAPKPPKEVKVIVQEAPSEQSARPTFRQRPTKTFYFTAAPSDVNK